MEFGFFDRHKSILKALKKVGFKVGEVVEQEKKTVITVSTARQNTNGEVRNEKEPIPDN